MQITNIHYAEEEIVFTLNHSSYLYGHTCFNFMFGFSVNIWHVALSLTQFFFFLSVSKSDFLRCQAAPRAQRTTCVICVMVSIARWRRPTCSADAVRRGQEYFGHCSASSTSTLPGSTCTLPMSALLWVSCVFVCVWLLVCLLLSHHHKSVQSSKFKSKGSMNFFGIFLPSCVSVETTCSTSVSSSSRSAAVKATTSYSRTTLLSVITILSFI